MKKISKVVMNVNIDENTKEITATITTPKGEVLDVEWVDGETELLETDKPKVFIPGRRFATVRIEIQSCNEESR